MDGICDYLTDSILNLRLKPGEQLNELRLIKKLGVSRSPIREAFRLLEGDGLISRYSRKGVYVREITANDVRELFPIRAALEGLAAELAAQKLTVQDLQNLERYAARMEDAATQRRDVRAYVKLNFEFHRQIVKGSHNRKLEELIRKVGQQSMWFFFASLYFKKAIDVVTSHKDIYLALKERDGKKAEICIKNHILEGEKKLLECFPPDKEESHEDHRPEDIPGCDPTIRLGYALGSFRRE